ncbi:MAG: branched-chain amino acid ABC transporter ATP-binding protein/permease [Firmicutes bacterium]|nr:branched-chain amino acid ABC transporter ATP-binding protein/permease [Bacillota bacterium]
MTTRFAAFSPPAAGRARALASPPAWAVVATAGALALVPLGVHDAFFLNAMITVFLFGTVAQAWNLIGGYAGQISFGHAVFFGLGAYTAAVLLKEAGVSPWLGMWAGAGIATLVSLAIGYPTFRLRRHFFALATLALGEIVRILFLNWPFVGAAVGYYLPLEYRNRPGYLMWDAKTPYFLASLTLFAIVTLTVALLDRRRVGVYLRAINQDEDAAAMLGLPTRRYKLYAMGLSAAFTALAGTLYALYVLYIDPYNVMPGRLSLLAVVIALIGGRATVTGPVLGAFFIVLLNEYTRSWLGGGGRGVDFILFGALVMLVSIREPGGLVGWLVRAGTRAQVAADGGPVSSSPPPATDSGPAPSSLPPAADSATTPSPPPPAADADMPSAHAGGTASAPQGDAPPVAPTTGADASPAAPAAARGAPVVLRIARLSKRFGGVQAVRNVSLEVFRGEICGLIGPNGAGKSTLFDCVTGVIRPDAGAVYLEDVLLTGREPHRVAWAGVARTFQAIRIFPELTAWENLRCAQEHRAESLWTASTRPDPPEVPRRAGALLEQFGLWPLRDLPAGALSYGQQKLLSLAMAVLRQPRLVLLDEPAAGVNPVLVEAIARHIRRLNATGITFLVIEHNMDLIMNLAHRVVFMAGGEIVAVGPPEAIQADETVRELYYGR